MHHVISRAQRLISPVVRGLHILATNTRIFCCTLFVHLCSLQGRASVASAEALLSDKVCVPCCLTHSWVALVFVRVC